MVRRPAARPTSPSRVSASCGVLVPEWAPARKPATTRCGWCSTESDPEAVVWLLSRAISYMDEQGFPDLVPGARPE